MQIRAFQLHNYGRFESLEVSLMKDETTPANVIVLVGNNGAGKTSILKGLATSLSWFVARLRSEKGSGSPIAEHVIRNGASSAEIYIELSTDLAEKQPYQWTLTRTRPGRVANRSTDLSGATAAADHFRVQLTSRNHFNLPLMAYYPVERSVLETPLKTSKKNAFDQLSGYEESFSPAIGFAKFFEWFRDREDHENEMATQFLSSNKELLALSALQAFELEPRVEGTNGLTSVDPHALMNYADHLKAYSELLSAPPKDVQLSAVRSAVEHFMPGFSNLRVQRKPRLQLMVDKDGRALNILQLSQGEKTLMALVGDIARRLAMMNPGLVDPLHGSGIVLIDEVDMHLHPTWQRDIIRNLVRTFPNCQFILTTHSPLVISDYPDVLVFSLTDGQLEQVPSQFGQDANTVLLDVMDTHIRNREVGSQLNDALDAIQTGDVQKARELIAKLEAQLPPSNLELAKAKLFLRKQELRFEKDR